MSLGARTAQPEDLTQLGLTFQYARYADTYRGSDAVQSSTELDASIATLVLRHHFGDGWSADLGVPTGTITLDPGQGESRRRVSGFGDLELGASYDFSAIWGAGGYRPSLTLRGAVGLPTGRQATIGEETDAVPPNILSLGNGAWGVAGELRLTQFVSRRIGVALPVSARTPLGPSESGAKMGAVFGYGADLLVLPGGPLLLQAGLSHQIRTASHEDGEGEVVNSGGRVLCATASVGVRASSRLAFGVGGRLPLHTDVHGQQVAESWSALGTVSLSFGGQDEDEEHDHGAGDEHDHGEEHDHGHGDAHGHGAGGAHDHGEEHDHGHGDAHGHGAGGAHGHGGGARTAQIAAGQARGDVADVARGGRSFSLRDAVVPGKISVVDFWADWCHPCKHIDQALRGLAARHPNLAVRRVEVPDFDAPVAAQHLPGVRALPVVWIHDATGRRRHTLVAATREQVMARVKELLAEPTAGAAR